MGIELTTSPFYSHTFRFCTTTDLNTCIYMNNLLLFTGSNKYCLDVNYGGVLIVWDRLFGTFRPETDKIEIVYGLIYNQPSFNPMYLQVRWIFFLIFLFSFTLYPAYVRVGRGDLGTCSPLFEF